MRRYRSDQSSLGGIRALVRQARGVYFDDHDGDADVDRAPICPACGVTALPAHLSHVIDSDFVCDNDECEGYGEPV